MKTNEQDIQDNIAARVLEARNILGLSQEEAAGLLGIPRLKLHEWENGKRFATIADLEKIAEVYCRDLDFFTSETKEDSAFQVLLRSTKEDKNTYQTVMTFEKYCNNYHSLCEVLSHKGAHGIPADLSLDQSRPLEEWMSRYAEEQRESLGLGRGPISNLREVLEDKLSIKVFFNEMSESISGMFTFGPKLGGSIMINTKDRTAGHQHFSLAHEFGHFLFHKRKLALISKERSDLKEELEANTFAEYFLMPAQAVRDSFYDRIGKDEIAGEDVLYLADYYRVSFKAMTLRLKHLKLINSATCDKLYTETKVAQLRAITGFKELEIKEEKFPKIYFYLLVKAFKNKLVTAAALSKFLDIDLWTAKLEAKKMESLFLNEAAT